MKNEMRPKLKDYQKRLDILYEATKKMPWGAELTRDAIEIARALMNLCVIQDEQFDLLYERMENERRLP